MSVEKLERVMWRLRKRHPNKVKLTIPQLRLAIMHECGTDPYTYKVNKAALVRLGWIKSLGRTRVALTGKDITGDE